MLKTRSFQHQLFLLFEGFENSFCPDFSEDFSALFVGVEVEGAGVTVFRSEVFEAVFFKGVERVGVAGEYAVRVGFAVSANQFGDVGEVALEAL